MELHVSENENSYAGQHEGFVVYWNREYEGWYWYADSTGSSSGPFGTSQAAYNDYKDQVDEGYQCHVNEGYQCYVQYLN